MLALYLLAAHMAGDYLFQSSWMAANKLADWRVRLVHVGVYALCFVPIAAVYGRGAGYFQGLGFLAALAAAHFVTDSHRWRTSNPWPAMPILQDQSLHVVQLAVFGGLFLSH